MSLINTMTIKIKGSGNNVTKFRGKTIIGSPTSYVGDGTESEQPVSGAKFNGTGQAIAVSNDSDFNFNGSSWTIEFFAKNADTDSMSTLWTMYNGDNISNYAGLRHNAITTYGSYEYKHQYGPFSFSNISLSVTSSTRSIKTSSWKHVALCYNSSDYKLRTYLDGDKVNESTNSNIGDWSHLTTVNDFTYFSIGAAVSGTNTIDNESDVEISNFRFVVGTALYTDSTSITVPSSNLTAITNTKLLLFNGGGTLTQDKSGTEKTVTKFGSVTSVAGPFE